MTAGHGGFNALLWPISNYKHVIMGLATAEEEESFSSSFALPRRVQWNLDFRQHVKRYLKSNHVSYVGQCVIIWMDGYLIENGSLKEY